MVPPGRLVFAISGLALLGAAAAVVVELGAGADAPEPLEWQVDDVTLHLGDDVIICRHQVVARLYRHDGNGVQHQQQKYHHVSATSRLGNLQWMRKSS